MTDPQGNFYAPDGYRYGVMFSDGSVQNCWNGRSQRLRAEQELARVQADYGWDYRASVARHLPGEPWERVHDDHAEEFRLGCWACHDRVQLRMEAHFIQQMQDHGMSVEAAREMCDDVQSYVKSILKEKGVPTHVTRFRNRVSRKRLF